MIIYVHEVDVFLWNVNNLYIVYIMHYNIGYNACYSCNICIVTGGQRSIDII